MAQTTIQGSFLDSTLDITGLVLSGASPLVFEGATADDFETTLTFVDPTADRTITFPNETGTVFTSGGNIALGGSVTKASDLTVDVEGDISLDANGGDIYLKDGGTIFATFSQNGGNLVIKNSSAEVAAISIAGDEVVTFADDLIIKDGGTIGVTSAATAITIASTGNVTLSGDLITTGAVTGVTSLTVDNINLNGNTISSTAGTDLFITPLAGQQLILDGAIIIDAGVVTGITALTVTGNILPGANNSHDLGSSSYQWQNIFTQDFHLNNTLRDEGNSIDGTKGDWTIQEGDENLFIVNNKTGKKYRFLLTEVF